MNIEEGTGDAYSNDDEVPPLRTRYYDSDSDDESIRGTFVHEEDDIRDEWVKVIPSLSCDIPRLASQGIEAEVDNSNGLRQPCSNG